MGASRTGGLPPDPAAGDEKSSVFRDAGTGRAASQELRDAWLRAKAECDNVRKRAQADIANAHKYALESFAAELCQCATAWRR
jgi:molecular chaperone GrpE (heat shock protein)